MRTIKLFSDIERIKRIYLFVAIPAVLTIIGCLINLATPVFFVVDEFNYLSKNRFIYHSICCHLFISSIWGILIYSYRKKVNKLSVSACYSVYDSYYDWKPVTVLLLRILSRVAGRIYRNDVFIHQSSK